MLAKRLSLYLSGVFILGLVALSIVATIYIQHLKKIEVNDKESVLTSFISSQIPVIISDVLDGNESRLKIRLEYLVLNNRSRGFKLKVLAADGAERFVSDEGFPFCLAGVHSHRSVVSFDGHRYVCVFRDVRQLGKSLGSVSSAFRLSGFWELFFQKNLHVTYFLLLTVFSLLFVGLKIFIRTEFERPLSQILNLLNHKPYNQDDKGFRLSEWKKVKNSILKYESDLISKSKELHEAELRLAKESAAIQISQQVAHDIRSPVVALQVLARDLGELEEEKRLLLSHSVERIIDISNDLNLRGRSGKEVSSKTRVAHLVAMHVDSLVSEKRIQYRDCRDVKIDFRLDEKSYGLFANINPTEFKRVLSNLINNSVEAFDGFGRIVVSLFAEGNDLVVQVKDNGLGIPQEFLDKVTKRGVTVGKEKSKNSGSGLGLFHAKETVESWDGRFKISSQQSPSDQSGTVVEIILPLAVAPSWFAKEILLEKDQALIVCDDDPSIHQVWKNRLSENRIPNPVHHFSSLRLFEKFYSVMTDEMQSTGLFLFDFEFLGEEQSGLDVVAKIKDVSKNIVLVTSRYDQDEVIQRVQELGVKMIPKGLVGFVPLSVSGMVDAENPFTEASSVDSAYDLVLIDDEPAIRSSWRICAKSIKKKIAVFESVDDFYDQCPDLDPSTPIYIDSQLKDGVRGEVIAKELFYDKGFKHIFLATGNMPDQYGSMPWIEKIVGKAPPFFN